MSVYITQKVWNCQGKTANFSAGSAYTGGYLRKGGKNMYSTGGPGADLDDLLFDEDSGGPSER